MAKTIHFNTGRLYTKAGQRITATLHDDNVVTFMDHDRMIPGEFALGHFDTFNDALVLWRYDHNEHQNTARAMNDGMMRDGCNTKTEG